MTIPSVEEIREDFLYRLDEIKEELELSKGELQAIEELKEEVGYYAECYHDSIEYSYAYFSRYEYDPNEYIENEIFSMGSVYDEDYIEEEEE